MAFRINALQNQLHEEYSTLEKNVFLCPCNLKPGKPWNPESLIKIDFGVSFNQVTNSFEYYNCNALAGYYAAFYIEA